MAAIAERTCVYCGKTYIGQGEKYCSQACNGRARRTRYGERVCQCCGKTYEGFGALYCSSVCQTEVRKRRVTLTCEQCGAVFERPASAASHRFCSRECKGLASRKPVPERLCEQCGKPFTGAYHHTRFCSLECSGLAHRSQLERTCRHCGKTFVVQLHRANAEYCSNPCWWAASHKVKIARITQLICTTCGKTFERNYYSKRYSRCYCSDACLREAWRKTDVACTCKFCGKAFIIKKSQHKYRATAGTFCSKSCHSAWETQFNQKRVSKIETQFMDALERTGVAIERQYAIGRYTVDGCHLLSRTVIEFDGDYWHNLPRAKLRDPRRERIIRKAGYQVIRIRESLWKSDPDQALNIVLNSIPQALRGLTQPSLWDAK